VRHRVGKCNHSRRVTGKSSGRRSADLVGVGAFEGFGRLNLIAVQKVELIRDDRFSGLLVMYFSSG